MFHISPLRMVTVCLRPLSLTTGRAVARCRTSEEKNASAGKKALFASRLGTVYFEHDAPNRRTHTAAGLVEDVSNVAMVFAVAPVEGRAAA